MIKIANSFFLLLLFLIPADSVSVCIGVNCYCNVNSNALDLGIYNAFTAPVLDGTGTINVTCGADFQVGTIAIVSYAINISQGNSGGFAQRYLVNGPYHMNYNIYTDAARTHIFGDGTGISQNITNAYTLLLQTSKNNTFSYYARIPAGQANIAQGTYTDNLAINVIY